MMGMICKIDLQEPLFEIVQNMVLTRQ